jgi:hypothetical protein
MKERSESRKVFFVLFFLCGEVSEELSLSLSLFRGSVDLCVLFLPRGGPSEELSSPFFSRPEYFFGSLSFLFSGELWSQLNQDRSSSGRRDRKKDEKNDNRKDESIDKNDKNISKRRMSERKKSSSDSDSSSSSSSSDDSDSSK